MKYYSESNHLKINKNRRCIKEESPKLGMEILASSVSAVRDKNIINNYEMEVDKNYETCNYFFKKY